MRLAFPARKSFLPAILLLSYLLVNTTDAVAASRQFLWLSDMHFDPTADAKLVDRLAQANVAEWPAIFATSPSGQFSPYKDDSNWRLLSAAMESARTTAPDTAFTIVTGDILVHRFRDKFQAAATDHSEFAFRSFVAKTLQFVTGQLRQIFPGKPVMITLGNNDAECGDYQVEPGGPFLKDSWKSVADLLGPAADESAHSDWNALGSYDIPLPSAKTVRVIAINSVYFSPKYRNSCGDGQIDAGAQQMKWLSEHLAAVERHGQRAWLLFHIPPGVDGYATARANANGNHDAVFMWKPEFTAEFDGLMTRYKKTVVVSLAGHEHMDDFRLLSDGVVILGPGLSPVVQQNPAYRIGRWNDRGDLEDENTYYLSNLDATTQSAPAEWKLEYSFSEAWASRGLNPDAFRRLYQQIGNPGDVRTRWSELYSVSHPSGSSLNPQSFGTLYCASGHLDQAGYWRCVKQMADKPR